MTQEHLITDLINDMVVLAFAASVLFIVVYTVLAPWWRSEIGRALIAMDTGLALALAPAVLHRLLGVSLAASLGFGWYYLGSLALVAGATLWRTWIIIKTQWRGRDGGQSQPPRRPVKSGR